MKKMHTVHLYESTQSYSLGDRSISFHDYRSSAECMKGIVWLGQSEVEIDWPDISTSQIQIEALEAQIQNERADSQARVNILLDRISKLKAITHEVAE